MQSDRRPLPLAADLLRPSTGEASPEVSISDTLSRIVGACARPPCPAFAHLFLSFVRGQVPRCQSPPYRFPVRGRVRRTQDAFHQLDLDLAAEGVVPRFPFTFARDSSHPFARRGRTRLVKGGPPLRAIPCRLGCLTAT
jgi:hypothetical protein